MSAIKLGLNTNKHTKLNCDAKSAGTCPVGLTSSGTDELMNTTVPPPTWERKKEK